MAVLDVVEREALQSLQVKKTLAESRLETAIVAIAARHGLKREDIAHIDLNTGDIVQVPPSSQPEQPPKG